MFPSQKYVSMVSKLAQRSGKRNHRGDDYRTEPAPTPVLFMRCPSNRRSKGQYPRESLTDLILHK